MTLKNRNRILLAFTLISLFIFTGTGVLTLFKYLHGSYSVPEIIQTGKFSSFFLFKTNFLPITISIFVLPFYAFLSLVFIDVEFEKTQSTELIYFSIFLTGCIFETARIAFPVLNLWESNTSFALLSSQITLFSRILCILSLFFSSIYSKSEYRQYVEQNILMLFVISILLAILLPFNTNTFNPLCHLTFGYKKLFFYSQIAVLVLTVLVQIINAVLENRNKVIPFGLVMMITGYLFLLNTKNYFFLGLGVILLFAGTYFYLERLHRQNLWND